MPRNKPWTRDELILALTLYHRLPASRFTSYRSPASIAMKPANFGHIDPDASSGLSAGSKQDRVIWEKFGSSQTRVKR